MYSIEVQFLQPGPEKLGEPHFHYGPNPFWGPEIGRTRKIRGWQKQGLSIESASPAPPIALSPTVSLNNGIKYSTYNYIIILAL